MQPEPRARMTKADIEELLRIKGWSQRQLAAELDVTAGAVNRWLRGNRAIKGTASKMLRHLLREAQGRQKRKAAAPA